MSYFAKVPSYAQLGESCQVSMDTLISAKKFLPLNDPLYNLFYTRMHHYPGVEEKHANPPEFRAGNNWKNCCGFKG